MGVEDVGDAPAQFLGLFQHRLGHRGVDDADQAARRLAREIDVVVRQDGNLNDFEFGHGCRCASFFVARHTSKPPAKVEARRGRLC